MQRTTRVRIQITVDVDTEAWSEEYGVAPQDVRSDVQNYVREAVANAPVPMIAVR